MHTNLGLQYTSNEYEEILKTLGITHSYSRKGCPYDNAGIESFHALLKKEHVYQRTVYRNFEEAKVEIFTYVQGFYNNRRIHSASAYVFPSQFGKAILAASKSLAKSVLSIKSDPHTFGNVYMHWNNLSGMLSNVSLYGFNYRCNLCK